MANKVLLKRNSVFRFVVLISTIFTAISVYNHFVSYPNDVYVLERLKGPLSPFDESLLRITYEKFLYPPSNEPYNLKMLKSEPIRVGFIAAMEFDKSWNSLYKAIKEMYPHKSEPGFFVEAGAYDGEQMSNTLYLEVNLGWSGLLVEPSSVNVKKIISKNRKTWLSPCCLATKPYPYKTFLQLLVRSAVTYDAMNSLIESKTMLDRTQYTNYYYEYVQCLPLQTLLMALNRTHVDLISLDVEDVEVPVLQYFSWDDITVDVWVVEHRHPENKFQETADEKDLEFIKFFTDKGYIVYKIFVLRLTDYIFVRKNSTFYDQNKHRLQLP